MKKLISIGKVLLLTMIFVLGTANISFADSYYPGINTESKTTTSSSSSSSKKTEVSSSSSSSSSTSKVTSPTQAPTPAVVEP